MGEATALVRRGPTTEVVARRRGLARWPVLSAGAGVVLGALLAWITRHALLDDAFITLDYARNLASHGCWCVTPGMLSNTATSPLWVVMLTVPMVVVGPVAALAVATAALLGALSLTVSSLAVRLGWSPAAGPVAAALVVSSPLLQASVGLESLLAVTLVAVGAHEVVAGRAVTVGLVAGALVLTRPDLAVVAAILVAVTWRRAAVTVPVAAATLAPWLAVSLAVFGTVLPDTLVWKTSQSEGLGGYFFGDAVMVFARTWPTVTWLGLAGAAGGAAAASWLLFRTRGASPVAVLAGGAVLHLAALLALHVAPYPWYPAPAAGIGLVVLALAAAATGPGRWVSLAACAVLVAGGALFSAQHDYAGEGSPLNYNRATPAQYAAVIDRAPDDAVIETVDELGALAFFCSDRCSVVDPLSDRGRLAPVLQARLSESPVLRLLYPGYEPVAPRRASHRAVSGDGGVGTFSGYGGASTMDIRPVR